MMLLKTKKGIITCTISDFKRFSQTKGILRRGKLIKEGKSRDFYSFDFELYWDDVLDWYDFNAFLYRNAEELVNLIDTGKLKVYDASPPNSSEQSSSSSDKSSEDLI